MEKVKGSIKNKIYLILLFCFIAIVVFFLYHNVSINKKIGSSYDSTALYYVETEGLLGSKLDSRMLQEEDEIKAVLQEYHFYRTIDQSLKSIDGSGIVRSMSIICYEEKQEKLRMNVYEEGILQINNHYYGCGVGSEKKIKELYQRLWTILEKNKVKTYVMETEENFAKPTFQINEKEQTFSFSYDALLSIILTGTYEIEDGILIATTSDKKNQYVFEIINVSTLQFVEEGSSEMKLIDSRIGVKVENGARFKLGK